MSDRVVSEEERRIVPTIFDSEEYRTDPFPTYKKLRDYHPLYHDRFHSNWVLSRYEDVRAAFLDNENYNRAVYEEDGPYEFGSENVFGPTILELGNGEKHRWSRGVVAGQFIGRNLESFIPTIERIAAETIDLFSRRAAEDIAKGFIKTGEVDLVEQFTIQYPIRVISGMLGLPREDEDQFVEWYQLLIAGLGIGEEFHRRGVQAREELNAYLDPFIQERRANPVGDDLITKIATAELGGQRMTDAEVKGFVNLLLAAGGDTTDKAIGNMWWFVLQNPDQFAELKRDPSLWDRAFTEMMRYDPPVHVQPRRTTREIAMYGKVIPTRANVTFQLGAANRDERVFKDTDKFDIFRKDLYCGKEMRVGYYANGEASHLGFGIGKHFCMGYAMARQESVIACQMLTEAMPNVRLKRDDAEGIVAPEFGSGGFRGPTKLELQFD